ncbi:MAG: hypothetical protein ACR2GY_07590 [Phycisphaerales bacterium]
MNTKESLPENAISNARPHTMGMQQIVILGDGSSNGEAMTIIGPRDEVLRDLAACNTASDGVTDDVLFGPGFRIELAPGQDPLTQMLLTIDDEDIAWIVLLRLARQFRWKLLDPMSGRELRINH